MLSADDAKQEERIVKIPAAQASVGEAEKALDVTGPTEGPAGPDENTADIAFEVPQPGGKKPKKWDRRVLVAVVAASLVGLTAGGWGLTYTPFFNAKVVRIEGARHLGQRQVLRLAGISLGVNVVHLDTGAAERRLESSPWVASALVKAELPSTVLVSITERVPVAIVRDGSGGSSLVAGDGALMGVASASQMLPEIESTNVSTVPTTVTLHDGAAGAESMTPLLRSGTKAIIVADDGSLLVLLRSGVAVSYGASSDLVGKDQSLQAVLSWAQNNNQHLIAIDVSVPSAPTATLAGGLVTRPR